MNVHVQLIVNGWSRRGLHIFPQLRALLHDMDPWDIAESRDHKWDDLNKILVSNSISLTFSKFDL